MGRSVFAVFSKFILIGLLFGISEIAKGTQEVLPSNPLYFKTLSEKAWAIEDAVFRLPVLITEPSGINRTNAPVGVTYQFPENIELSSIKVTTVNGKPIPSQLRIVDKKSNKVEVIFEVDIPSSYYMPVFIYYGTKRTPASQESSDLLLKDEVDSYLLANNRIKIRFLKKASKEGATFSSFTVVGRKASEITGISDYFLPGGQLNIVSPGTEAKITEDGPIRKSIKFGEGADAVTYSLYSESNLLYYCSEGENVRQRATSWTPGGDVCNDFLYYESPKGVKRFNVDYKSPENLKTVKLEPFLKEGWLAYCDEKENVTVGEIFRREKCRALNVYNHFTGYATTVNADLSGAILGVSLVDFRIVREAYFAWMSPLVLSTGEVQGKKITEKKAPEWGTDFWRIHMLNSRAGVPDKNAARKAVELAQNNGANIIHVWYNTYPQMPAARKKDFDGFLKDVVREAHDKNMGVIALAGRPDFKSEEDALKYSDWASPDGTKKQAGSCDPYLAGDKYMELIRKKINSGADAIWILDEYVYDPPYLSDAAKDVYRKKYGMDAPEKFDFSKMMEPGQFNHFKFRSETYTDLLKKLRDEAKRINPDIVTISTTSPNNVCLGHTYHDLEVTTEFMTTANLDLYMTDFNTLQFFIKYGRGAMGNDRPFLTFSGMPELGRNGGLQNCFLHLFFGANSMHYFDLTEQYSDRTAGAAAKETYELLDYTGLGSYLVKAHPQRFIGVLRDRDNFFGEIKRGECREQISVTDQHVKNLLASFGNYPVDIVFSKQLEKASGLDGYKAIFIPEDRDISEKTSEYIRDFISNGGIAFFEGSSIENKIVAQICSVVDQGTTVTEELNFIPKQQLLRGTDFKITASNRKFRCENSKVLAADSQGNPLLTIADCGKGKAVYCSIEFSSKIQTEDIIGEIYRNLLLELAGPPSVTSDNTDIRINVFSDNQNTLLAVYNNGKAKKFNLKFNLLAGEGVGLLSFRKGYFLPLKNKELDLSFGENEVDFFLVTSESALKKPLIKNDSSPRIYQSRHPVPSVFKELTLMQKSNAVAKKKIPGKIYVGVFVPAQKNGSENMGARSIMEFVGKLPDVQVEPIDEMTPDRLGYFDIVIVPNLTYSGRGVPEGWEKNLKEYVQNGGGALLLHHSVGCAPSSKASDLFPEIGEGVDFASLSSFKLIDKHPLVTSDSFQKRFPHRVKDPAFALEYSRSVMKEGDIIKSGFPDYIILKKGPDGQIVAKSIAGGDKGDTSAIIAGVYGKGKVVLSGMNLGCKALRDNKKWKMLEELTNDEMKILQNSIYWLSEK